MFGYIVDDHATNESKTPSLFNSSNISLQLYFISIVNSLVILPSYIFIKDIVKLSINCGKSTLILHNFFVGDHTILDIKRSPPRTGRLKGYYNRAFFLMATGFSFITCSISFCSILAILEAK